MDEMIGLNQYPVVIFDGDCGICNATRQWVQRRDRASRLSWQPYQRADLPGLVPGLTPEQASRAVYFVQPDGQYYRGARAIFETLRYLPGGWRWLGWIGTLPPVNWLAAIVYRIVAQHRTRISRWLRLDACRLDLPNARVEE